MDRRLLLQSIARQRAQERLDKLRNRKQSLLAYASDPVGFVGDVLGEHLWSRQREIAQALVQHRRVAVPSCHGSGKSHLASRLVAWWLSTAPQGDAFVVTSAPTNRQVRAILWRYIAQAAAKGQLPGKVTTLQWLINGQLVGFGMKPKDQDMTAFQGIHARRVLVVFDEATGIPPALWIAAETLLTNPECRILSIGNPDDPSSKFAEVCKPGSGWHVLPISVFNTPLFTHEAVPDTLRPLLTSPQWVEEQRKAWGESSPLWTSKVLGEFPDVSQDGLFLSSKILAACNNDLDEETGTEPVELGVDVARFGTDNTAVAARRGGFARIVKVAHGLDVPQVAGLVIDLAWELGATVIKVDDIGLGGGVTDLLKLAEREGRLPKGCKVYAINVAMAAPSSEIHEATKRSAKERFVNLRAWHWWGLRERANDGDLDLDPEDAALLKELLALKYGFTPRGQIQIESKEEMRKRGLPSPDRADALMLAFATPVKANSEGMFDFYRNQAA